MMNANNMKRGMKYDLNTFVEKVRQHEGLVLTVYKDTLGIDTIGIGRNLEGRGISKEELDYMDIPSIDAIYEHGITEADAYYLATNDIAIVENELARAKPCVYDLDAVRQLIVMDMAFNMGVPRLCKFKKMWAALKEQDYINASNEMLDSKWAEQTEKRAESLARIIRSLA